ncbi:MAG TPA: preprotein translocase subunit YajC [Acidimicrobiales bacterium]|nr:preprotein translocase subunit YajC [Acidimicrobiales bacterium]
MNSVLTSSPHQIAVMALAATTSSKSSGSSTLLLFILLFGAMYFLWLRPQRKKMQQRQLDQVRSIDIGDEVVTQSGIIGTVVGLDADRAEIQVSTGVVLTVVRAAIGRRVDPVVPEAPFEDGDSDDSGDPSGIPQTPLQKGRLWKRRGRGEDA